MILDIILILAVLFFAFLGAKKGFTNSVLAFLNKIVALVVSLIFAKPFASVLAETSLLGVAEGIVEPISSFDIIAAFTDTSLTSILANWLLIAFAFVILYIVSYIAFKILRSVADMITNLPVLKQFDSLLGFALGVFETLLATYVLLAILSIFETTTIFTGLFDSMYSSYLVNFLYENNLIMNFLFSYTV